MGARSRDPDEIARESRAPCHDGAGLPLESRAGSDARRGGTRLSRRPRAAWCRRAAWTRRGESCRLQLRGSRVTAAAGGRPLALFAACLLEVFRPTSFSPRSCWPTRIEALTTMSAGRAHPKLSKAQSFPLSAEDHGAAQYWRLAAHHNSAPHLPSAHITCTQWLIALSPIPVHRSRRHGLDQCREWLDPEKECIDPAEDGAPRTLPERRAGTGYQGPLGSRTKLT